MPVSFTVLASGSSGNASVLELDSIRVLIDCGVGPRQLADRLRTVGLSWPDISAVVLTHTHGDHWRETTFKHFGKFRIPFFCHAHHARCLQRDAESFQKLADGGLVRTYVEASPIDLGSGLYCWPIPISHDGGPTFGFRFVAKKTDGTKPESHCCLLDGSWRLDSRIGRIVANVDLLALEFNHDVEMELSSGRSSHLIERVLSKNGHLSNEQAAQFLKRGSARFETRPAAAPGSASPEPRLQSSGLGACFSSWNLGGSVQHRGCRCRPTDVPSQRMNIALQPIETVASSSRIEESAIPVLPLSNANATRVKAARYSSLQPLLPGF